MASFLDDLKILPVILGDIYAFAAGQPVSTPEPVRIGNCYLKVSAQGLPNGLAGSTFKPILGNAFDILMVILEDYAAFNAGAPVSIAVKEGKSWYGISFSLAAAVSQAPAPTT